MYTALVLCTILIQRFWCCGLNSLHCTRNSVCEVDLNRALNTFEYKFGYVANDGLNYSKYTAGLVEREGALVGDTEPSEYLGVICLYQHAKYLYLICTRMRANFQCGKRIRFFSISTALRHSTICFVFVVVLRVRSVVTPGRVLAYELQAQVVLLWRWLLALVSNVQFY
jgi:hypothetical protein